MNHIFLFAWQDTQLRPLGLRKKINDSEHEVLQKEF